jgi:hypothetical protein
MYSKAITKAQKMQKSHIMSKINKEKKKKEKIRDTRESRKKPIIDKFHVFCHSAVTPSCDLQKGQAMNMDTIDSAYAIAPSFKDIDFTLLGLEVHSQIGTRGKSYDEHITILILKDKLIIQKIEFKKENVPYNSIIEIPCGDIFHQIAANEEIGAKVVFHKTGSYIMKSRHGMKTECKNGLKFVKHAHTTKYYSNAFNYIECFVMQL